MKKSNVLIVHHGHNLFAGNSQSLIQLLSNIDQDRFRPIVACCKGTLKDRISSMGYQTLTIPLSRLISYRFKIFNKNLINPLSIIYFMLIQIVNYFIIISFIWKYEIDIIHSNTQPSKFYTSFASKTMRRSIIWHEREIQPKGLRRTINNYSARYLSDVIIAVSSAVAKTFDVTQKNIKVIHNSINLEDYRTPCKNPSIREEIKLDSKCLIVGYVGRFIPWKGVHIFLEAAKLVAENDTNVHFVVVGDSTEERYSKYKEQILNQGKNIDKNIISFLGLREDIPCIMKSIDILVVPSVEPEPFGRVVIEGLAGSAVVIGSKIGGIPEILKDDHGILVDPNDPEELAKKISRLLQDNCTLQTYKAAALNRSIDFDVKTMTNSIERIYQELI